MTKLECCLENAIAALEEGKDFDTWLYEERNKGNIHAWGNSDAVLTDASVIDVKDIWELASYVQFVVVQNVKTEISTRRLENFNSVYKEAMDTGHNIESLREEYEKRNEDEYR